MEEKRIKYLPSEFSVDYVDWKREDYKEDKWYIYQVRDNILDDSYYIVFKFKTTLNRKYSEVERQVRPSGDYEIAKNWFKECTTKEECYKYLREVNLI